MPTSIKEYVVPLGGNFLKILISLKMYPKQARSQSNSPWPWGSSSLSWGSLGFNQGGIAYAVWDVTKLMRILRKYTWM